MIAFKPLTIEADGTDVAIPSTPAAARFCTAVSCASPSAPAGPVTLIVTPRSFAAILAASIIC